MEPSVGSLVSFIANYQHKVFISRKIHGEIISLLYLLSVLSFLSFPGSLSVNSVGLCSQRLASCCSINPFPECHLVQLWEIHIGPITEEHDRLPEMQGIPVNENNQLFPPESSTERISGSHGS